MNPILVHGMHGLGDNLHQRAIIRQLMLDYNVYLETPWPSVYHDLFADGLRVVQNGSTLRTQAKNLIREIEKYSDISQLNIKSRMRITYPPSLVRNSTSVFAAMVKAAMCEMSTADFRLPIPKVWANHAIDIINTWNTKGKPIMIYRPLNDRVEWGGCNARNPDYNAYSDLFNSIRNKYFVVSVADFEQDKEWMVGNKIDADVEYHNGELYFELLAAIVRFSDLVYTSPGFLVILGQAVGTAGVVIFGGYENSKSFSDGAKFAPYLGIDPIIPCECFSHNHHCDKHIDMPKAKQRLMEFINAVAS